DRRAERDAPNLDLPFILELLQLGKSIVAELRQLDVVGHVQIEMIRADALKRSFNGDAHELRREILSALFVRAGLAGIGVKVVAEFPADLELAAIDLRLLHPLAEECFCAAVAV